MYWIRFMALVCLASVCVSGQGKRQHDPDEGTLGSVRLGIPEPMVFDLIRPLGASKGEIEVNSLFRMVPGERPRTLQYAPEIEYTLFDGFGIEFEVPMENAHVDAWKGAVQHTLPGPFKKYFTHGWQTYIEAGRNGGGTKANYLYLAGTRLNPQWSVMTMNGVEQERRGESSVAFVGNYTVFYQPRDSRSYGLETNFKGSGITESYRLLMPQVQFRGNRLNVQVGAGWRWQGPQRGFQLACRISREF